MVYRRPPRGTFVAEPRVRIPHRQLLRGGLPAGPQARPPGCCGPNTKTRRPSVRLALELDDGAMVHVFHRLRTVDDVPFALETTFLPADLTPGILDEPDDGSLWAIAA